jgi:hypothetical protein
MEDAALGEVVIGVMDELDAAHLRPTGIAARLADGVDAACHGVLTLLANIPEDGLIVKK